MTGVAVPGCPGWSRQRLERLWGVDDVLPRLWGQSCRTCGTPSADL